MTRTRRPSRRALTLTATALVAAALLGSPAAFAAADEPLEVTVSNIVIDTATPAVATVSFDYAPNTSATLPDPPYLLRVYVSPAGVDYWETDNGARADIAVNAAGSYRNTSPLAPGGFVLSIASYPVLDCGDCGGAEPHRVQHHGLHRHGNNTSPHTHADEHAGAEPGSIHLAGPRGDGPSEQCTHRECTTG